MHSKIKVAIVDDQEIVRTGFIGLLAPYDDIQVMLEAGNGQDLIDKLPSNPVDVIIMDIKMPILDGIETLKIIRQNNKIVRIIMLSIHEEKSYVLKSVEAKANGYLSKTAKASEIYLAIKTALSEGTYFSEFASEIMLKDIIHKNQINPFDNEPVVEFDERQSQILKLLYLGKTSIEIGKELLLSKRTVDSCRSCLLEMTNTPNTIELIKWCIKNKIFE